jgi:probable F420-dependent oxidoreductase
MTRKVRIGFGLGTRTPTNDERFGPFVDALEALGFDSLWVSERITGEAPDPVVAMSFAAGRTQRLKFGMSVMVLPGRNPVLVAKELASLANLAGPKRLLPAFGLGAADAREHQAFGVTREGRAKLFDESLTLMRRLWAEDAVTFHGEHYRVDELTVLPKPPGGRLDVWLGGIAPSELRRVGRLADGWLPSFVTVPDVKSGIATIKDHAGAHGREIEDDHFGVLIPYQTDGELNPGIAALLARRRPDISPSEIVPVGWPALREMIERFVEVGASKFVLIPAGIEPDDWFTHLDELASEVLPLEAALSYE